LQACLKTLCDVGAEIAKALNDALASMRIPCGREEAPKPDSGELAPDNRIPC